MSVEQLHPVVDAYQRMCTISVGLCDAIMDVIPDLDDGPRERLSGALASAAAQTVAIEAQLAAAPGEAGGA